MPPPDNPPTRYTGQLRSALETTSVAYSVKRIGLAERAAAGGALGSLIGDFKHHASSIAFITILGLLVLLLCLVVGMFRSDWTTQTTFQYFESMKTIILSLIALMGTILGYIFGRGVDARPAGQEAEKKDS